MKLKISAVTMQTTEDSKAQMILTVDPISRGAIKPVINEARKWLEKDGVLSCELNPVKKRRSLPQNALLWRLLTIYADTINGGRTGGETPETLYYKMLEKYGVAVFVAVPDVCIEDLKRSYRRIKIIDETIIERNGKRTPAKTVKCILGSSKYTTEQMTKLIDGIFDELAMLGVDCGEELTELYQDWQERSVNK